MWETWNKQLEIEGRTGTTKRLLLISVELFKTTYLIIRNAFFSSLFNCKLFNCLVKWNIICVFWPTILFCIFFPSAGERCARHWKLKQLIKDLQTFTSFLPCIQLDVLQIACMTTKQPMQSTSYMWNKNVNLQLHPLPVLGYYKAQCVKLEKFASWRIFGRNWSNKKYQIWSLI